jgi:hypothetical protein
MGDNKGPVPAPTPIGGSGGVAFEPLCASVGDRLDKIGDGALYDREGREAGAALQGLKPGGAFNELVGDCPSTPTVDPIS